MTDTDSGNKPDEGKGLRSLVTDAMVIAAATAFAYFSTFVYELGFCFHFDLPIYLINPNVPTILVAACGLCGVLLATVNWIGFTAPLFRAARDPNKASLRPLYLVVGALGVLGVILSKAYGLGWRGNLLLLLGLAGICVLFFHNTFLFYRKTTFEERVKKDMTSAANDSASLGSFLELWLNRQAMIYFFVVSGFLGLAWTIGNGNATTQTLFLTLKDAPDTVVLRSYGDLLILAKFSRQTKQLSNELSLFWLSEKKQLEFRNEFVGPLSLPEDWGRAPTATPMLPGTGASSPSPQAPSNTPASAAIPQSNRNGAAPASTAVSSGLAVLQRRIRSCSAHDPQFPYPL